MPRGRDLLRGQDLPRGRDLPRGQELPRGQLPRAPLLALPRPGG